MSKDIKEYLHYYIGQKHRYRYVDWEAGHWSPWYTLTSEHFDSLDDLSIDGIQLLLRKLEDMTEEEMVDLLLSMVPDDMEDKPEKDDYSLELFYNDGGNQVDWDVAIGADYSCRCFEGQFVVRKCGTIDLYGEGGSKEHLVNVPKAFHYLLSKGFDLFGLIDAGLAIDAKTL